LETLPPWAHDLLAGAPVARLAYAGVDGRPRVLPVTFAVAGESVWSAIDDKPKRTREPARIAALRRRPDAALLVDVYHDDWSRLAWVQVTGRVELVTIPAPGEEDADHAEPAVAALAAKYPQYAERTPPGPLLRLVVARAVHWRASDAPASAGASGSGSTGSPRPDHSLQDPG
jgi:PPOX class probable F420-dependent enzyme